MLKIGDFSRLCSISIRMLRYYDENDVLKPSYVDEENGYRFYNQKQLFQAFQINFLRELGFSISTVKEIMKDYHNDNELISYLNKRKIELIEEHEHIQELISRIEKAEITLNEENILMKYQVNVKEIKGMDAISKRSIIPSYDREDLLWKGMFGEINERKIKVSYSKDKARAYFHDEGYKDKEVDVEICVGVTEKFTETDQLTYRHCKTQTCACVTYTGDYSNITEISTCIGSWIMENGYDLDGPNFCIYHKGYSESQNPSEFITEICFPIKK